MVAAPAGTHLSGAYSAGGGRPPPPPMEVFYQEPQELEYAPPSPPPPGQPQTLVRTDGLVEGTPHRLQLRTPVVLDIEMLTPTPGRKHRQIRSPYLCLTMECITYGLHLSVFN